jgi:hypothetical protein
MKTTGERKIRDSRLSCVNPYCEITRFRRTIKSKATTLNVPIYIGSCVRSISGIVITNKMNNVKNITKLS